MTTLAEIQDAARLLCNVISPTPLVRSDFLCLQSGAEIYLKLECLQRTGSFKLRGAYCKIARCRDRIGPKGVVAASAGNHAQGVALAASQLGVHATVVMPENASIAKQLATQGYGADVILRGEGIAQALTHAKELAAEGYTLVHPFDDEDIIAGQGTLGLEIVDSLPEVDEIWVPVGGGGLIAGVATAVKETRPDVRVVGVQAATCAAALAARCKGRPVTIQPGATLADGIAVSRIGVKPFAAIQRYVDELVTVSEDEIAAAIVRLLEHKKVLAEGAGATPLAALLSADAARLRDRRIALVISGGNLELHLLERILERGLIRTGRMLRFQAVLKDVPGALASLLRLIADQGANVLLIRHDRLARDIPIGSSRVEAWVETRGFDQATNLCKALASAGFPDALDPCSEP